MSRDCVQINFTASGDWGITQTTQICNVNYFSVLFTFFFYCFKLSLVQLYVVTFETLKKCQKTDTCSSPYCINWESVVLLFVCMQNKQKKVPHKIRNQHALSGVQCTFRQTTQTQQYNLIFCCYSTVQNSRRRLTRLSGHNFRKSLTFLPKLVEKQLKKQLCIYICFPCRALL